MVEEGQTGESNSKNQQIAQKENKVVILKINSTACSADLRINRHFQHSEIIYSQKTVDVSLLKNLTKYLGDFFEKFLREKNIATSASFKDKGSLKLLNAYLNGSKLLNDLPKESFISLFLDFLGQFQFEQLERRYKLDNERKNLYSLFMEFLKESYNVIEKNSWMGKLTSLTVRRLWPPELNIKWKDH
jgi:hypothetical protein